MADDELEEGDNGGAEEEEFEGDEEEGGGPPPGRKRLLIVIAAVLALILGGVAAAYFTGMLQPVIDMLGGGEVPAEESPQETVVSAEAVFYDVPEMLVNINTGGRKAVFLKIRVSLELENSDDIAQVEAMMPRIIDNFQIYLRELRIEDLKGSAGMYRLREELLKRVNVAVSPAKVNDVLFKEMLVQ